MATRLMEEALEDVTKKLGGRMKDIGIKELVVGVNYTAVRLSTDDIGFANTLLDEFSPETSNLFSRAGTVADQPLTELVRLAKSWDLSERVVGIAALNALSQCAVRTGGVEISRRYGDVVRLTKVKRGDTIVMVGNMRHSVEKLKPLVKEVLVLERTTGLRDKGTFPDTAAEAVIPRGDVVFLTGASLCNGTTDRILELSSRAREVIIMGASAGIFPPTLFRNGVTGAGLVEISDPDRAMKVISQGGGNPGLRNCGREVVYKPLQESARRLVGS